MVQGSEDDAAIVRLVLRTPADAVETVALVGKGICFDSGGHNLKPAKYMLAGMHEDMAGSAVVLGILLAATRPPPAACHRRLAGPGPQRHLRRRHRQGISSPPSTEPPSRSSTPTPRAAWSWLDALALAVRDDPDLVIDFATLTGSMVTALGTATPGVLTEDAGGWRRRRWRPGGWPASGSAPFPWTTITKANWRARWPTSAMHPGRRGRPYPGGPFPQALVGDLPWLHVDLAAAAPQGRFGAIGSDQTGLASPGGWKFLTERLQPRNPGYPGSNPAT